MLDPESMLFMFVMTIKAWASTLFYLIAIYYMISKLRKRKK